MIITLVPGSPPLHVDIYDINAYTIGMSWQPPAVPNGVVINYTLYFNFDNGTNDTETVDGSDSEFILEELNPHQEVSVRISASTSIGEGPLSDSQTVRTHEAGDELLIYFS